MHVCLCIFCEECGTVSNQESRYPIYFFLVWSVLLVSPHNDLWKVFSKGARPQRSRLVLNPMSPNSSPWHIVSPPPHPPGVSIIVVLWSLRFRGIPVVAEKTITLTELVYCSVKETFLDATGLLSLNCRWYLLFISS